jgi:thiamine-monophosphate kinase
VDEFELIRRFFSTGYPQRADVMLGVGDDSAISRLGRDEELVSCSDTLVAGTHFPPQLPADAVAHRALAANLSDLAAMGASPRWFLLALALPEVEPGWLEQFSAGLARLAGRYQVALIGGDTVRGPLSVTITALGSVPAGAAVRRSGAVDGDLIYVTGTCGDAARAWQALAGGATLAVEDPCYRRFAYPEPRVREGLALRDLASAMIDISDGLHVDLERLLAASEVGGAARAQDVPLSAALVDQVGLVAARELALAGGDDYELCFSVAQSRATDLGRLSADWSCPPVCIGQVRSEPGLSWQLDGRDLASPPPAFQHF